MIKLNFGALADNAHVDASGKLYILGEFRYILAPTVPARHGHLAVVARWTATTSELDKTHSLEVEIVDQDGSAIIPRSPRIEFKFAPIGPAAHGEVQAQIVLQMDGLLLPKFGNHAINFWVDGVTAGRIPFFVTQLPPGQTAPNVT